MPRDGVRSAAPLALSRVLQGGLGSDRGGRAARRAHRDRRGLPRPRERRPVVRRRPQAGRGRPGRRPGATSLSCSLGVSTSKVVCKVASDRRKPGGITVVPPGTRGAIPRAAAQPHPAGRRAAGGGAACGRGRPHDRRARGARRRRAASGAPGSGGPAAAGQGQRSRPARPRARDRAHLDLHRGDLRPRSHRPRRPARRAAAHGRRGRLLPRARRALGAHRDDEAPLLRLLAPLPLDDPCRPRSTSPTGSQTSRAPCSIAVSATGRERCGWSASASPG